MKFSNHPIPEGINAGRDSPLRDLFLLGGSIVAGLCATLFLLFWSLQLIAPWVPFSWERQLTADLAQELQGELSPEEEKTRQALQALAQRLAAVMDLPAGMSVTVHYLPAPTDPESDPQIVNAFATLGGHVVVTDALLQVLPDENAIAMVLAHEIAHVRHRDPLRGASLGLLSLLVQSLLFGNAGDFQVLSQATALLSLLSHTRDMEETADAAALTALVALYGHGEGATDLFARLNSDGDPLAPLPDLLRSHPNGEARVALLRRLAAEQDWPLAGTRHPWNP